MSRKSGALERRVRHKTNLELTLWDRLSRLTYPSACKLLGEHAARLIRAGGMLEINVDEQVRLEPDELRVTVPHEGRKGDALVRVRLRGDKRDRLAISCSTCHDPCEHQGAAIALILEEKALLGLAELPVEDLPLEHLDPAALVARALAEREERAQSERMRVRSADPQQPFSDYLVTSGASGKTYRVALRGLERGDSYCSCPDFRKNGLGTCKHLLRVQEKVRRRFSEAALAQPYRRTQLSLHVRYAEQAELRLALPLDVPPAARALIEPLCDRAITDIHDLIARLRELEQLRVPFTIYPDAEAHMHQALRLERLGRVADDITKRAAEHPLRQSLLREPLLPYQLEGIAFVARAGRALLADEMGLGKTVQAIGAAELLAREAGIERVLVVCPASVKAQWRAEIKRFTDRSAQLVSGRSDARHEQYRQQVFFTICNYEQVLRDLSAIETVAWDLIVLDEGQRIKNWEAKTSAVIKSLRSPFALVLSGTPLENRLEELYSVVEFIDERRLGPAFSFLHRHRVVSETGKVLGYKDLDRLREALRPLMLRRTRAKVLAQLPARTMEIVRIPPTDEQLGYHVAQMRIVAAIVRKRYISEMDLLRLQKALLLCRLVANSTYLVDKQAPGYSTKLAYLDDLFARFAAEPGRKAVLFSEWTTMLDLIEERLERHDLRFVRLDGSVPQKARQRLVSEFQRNADCRLFLATNAGATGLNLQAANTVINVDLPWNPAVLEQRIGRAHRMGQKQPVHVFVLVSEGTIEDNLLATLSAKSELALAALDVDSTVDALELPRGMDELKRRLEVLLGAEAIAPVDESAERARKLELERRREQVAEAGGRLLSAAFDLFAQLLPEAPSTAESEQLAARLKTELSSCFEPGTNGKPKLTVTLPDTSAFDGLIQLMARALTNEASAAPRN